MAAQGERELGDIVMGEGLLGPMVQDISEQDIVTGEQELPPQMDPKTNMAAACDTSHPLPHKNPPPIPAETVHPGAFDMAQLVAILAGMEHRMEEKMDGNTKKMEEKIDGNTDKMEKMRGEMQNMGAGLQDGLEQLKIGNGELRRATCWGRLVEVTEEVTVTETCTREIKHMEITEYTEMTRVEERLHGVEVKDAHTHTHR